METNTRNINAYLAFFIIHTSQIGMGILGVPKIIFLEANKDAWISIILSGLFISFLTWLIISILKRNKGKNLYEIHENLFGRFMGNIINLCIVIYFIELNYSIIISYIELAITWGYEGIYEWVGTLALILITIYAVLGGFRVIVGVCFLSFFMTIWMIFIIYQPLSSIDYIRILPVLSSTPDEILNGVFRSSYTMLGFETLFFIFPFIKEKKKLHLYSQLAIWFTIVLLLTITIISILYFSPKELEDSVWPLVSMISSVRFPFIERFEVLAISLWILVIFPNLCLSLFISSKGVKHIFNLKQKHGIWVISLFIFVSSFFITKRVDNDIFIDKIGLIGFYLWFIYPVFLYFIIAIKPKIFTRTKRS